MESEKPVDGLLSSKKKGVSKEDIKTLVLSSFGGTLEFYDFIIYVFFAHIIGEHFFPSNDAFWTDMKTYGTFAAGYILRPVGGVVMSHFGDIIGRKKMFTLSILLMAVPTFVMGFIPTYEKIGVWAPIILILLRICQGVAIGGELPGAWVFIAEHAPKNKMGLFDGILTMGVVGGILMGSVVANLMEKFFEPDEINDWAWRIPFVLGGAFGFITMYLRRWLKETPVFIEMQKKKALSKTIPIKTVIKKHQSSVWISALFTWVLTGCVVAYILLNPNIMTEKFHISREYTFTIHSWVILTASLGCVVSGYLCDKIGAGKTYMLFGFGILISTQLFYYYLNQSQGTDLNAIAITFIIGGFFVGILGTTPYVLVHLYPSNIRFTGISFSYNLTYAIAGGVTPPLIIWLSKENPAGIGYYMLFIALLTFLAGFFLAVKKKL